MSFLPAGTPLRSVLPDLDDLLENPAGYLAVGPVVIGPRRMYGLAALFAVPGVAFLLSYFLGKPDPERIALGVGMLVGAAIWFGWSLWSRGHSLVLHSDGVEICYFNQSVWCPWALFRAEGAPHDTGVDSPFSGLIVPIAEDALPFIELRRAESVVAHGAQVRAPQLILSGDEEVILTGRYEVVARELGDLLLQLGHSLGDRLPRGAPPKEAYQIEPIEVADPDPSGWFTVRATRLRLPPKCCGCGEATIDQLPFELWSRGGAIMRMLVGGAGHEIAVNVPVCASCREQLRSRQGRAGMRGLLVGALIGPVALLVGELGGWGNAVSAAAGLGLSAAGALLGFGVGHSLGYRPPVQFRNFSASRGTVQVRFQDPEYAALVLALMRQKREQAPGR